MHTTTQTMTVTVELDRQLLIDTLICAREGGSNYWARFEASPQQLARQLAQNSAFGLYEAWGDGAGPILVHECDEDGEIEATYELTPGVLAQGFKLYAEKRGKIYWTADHALEIDADIADEILQYAVLGELRYG